MRHILFVFAFCAALPLKPANAPSFSNEHLRYSINWPSGLSLGEGQLVASRSKPDGDQPRPPRHELQYRCGRAGFSGCR